MKNLSLFGAGRMAEVIEYLPTSKHEVLSANLSATKKNKEK